MRLIIHCSDSAFGNAILINQWHLERGWSGIGYHAVILNGRLTSKLYNKYFDGNIETGRPFNDDNLIDKFETGAHTFGHNAGTLSVCLIGNSGQFTVKQIESLKDYCKKMRLIFGKLEISQHSNWDNKKPLCAGLKEEFLINLNSEINNDEID